MDRTQNIRLFRRHILYIQGSSTRNPRIDQFILAKTCFQLSHHSLRMRSYYN